MKEMSWEMPRKKLSIKLSCYVPLKQVKILMETNLYECLNKVIHQTDKIDACFLCFFR